MNMAEILDSWLNGRTIPPIVALLGVRLISAQDGQAVAELPVRPDLFNAMGSLHGGVFADLADITIGAAIASAAEPEELFTTSQLSLHYFAAVREGTVRAKASLIRRGRTTGYAECDLLDATGLLVAKATSTCSFQQPRV